MSFQLCVFWKWERRGIHGHEQRRARSLCSHAGADGRHQVCRHTAFSVRLALPAGHLPRARFCGFTMAIIHLTVLRMFITVKNSAQWIHETKSHNEGHSQKCDNLLIVHKRSSTCKAIRIVWNEAVVSCRKSMTLLIAYCIKCTVGCYHISVHEVTGQQEFPQLDNPFIHVMLLPFFSSSCVLVLTFAQVGAEWTWSSATLLLWPTMTFWASATRWPKGWSSSPPRT